MNRIRRSFLAGTVVAASAACCLAVVPATAVAHGFRLGAIAIGHPWARATVPGQPTGAGYLRLDNRNGGADRLVAARSPACERVEMHAMWMDNDIMRMRRQEAIELPAGAQVELKPAGMHLMLVGLKAPLKAGDKFPLTLVFEKAGTVEVTMNVQAEAPGGGAAKEHGGMKH